MKIQGIGILEFGAFGLPVVQETLRPTAIDELKDEHIISAAVGDRHSLYMTASGKRYGRGDNSEMQLGLFAESTDTAKRILTQAEKQNILSSTAINFFANANKKWKTHRKDNNVRYMYGQSEAVEALHTFFQKEGLHSYLGPKRSNDTRAISVNLAKP